MDFCLESYRCGSVKVGMYADHAYIEAILHMYMHSIS